PNDPDWRRGARLTFRLRVMTYNLLYGFHERDGDAMVFQPARAAAARDVVRAEAPDVLALTEAAYVAGGRVLRQDFVALFGLPFLYADGMAGEWGSALLSRYPMRETARLPLGARPDGGEQSAVRAIVDTPAGALRVDVVHPSPHITEAERV